MKCCANCFGDRGLRNQIIPIYSDAIGVCSFCKSTKVELVHPNLLGDVFELLLGIYSPDQNGKNLVELLKEDWKLFDHENMDFENSKNLLSKILEDDKFVERNFSPRVVDGKKQLDIWEQLRNELMHKNRFFPTTKFDEKNLENLLSHLILDDEELYSIDSWYRARIQDGKGNIFPIDEMGAPPNHLAPQGRANPAGIPYLYLASTPDSAVAEVRPHTGEFATVGHFSLNSELKVIDLRNPRSTVSPFILSDEDEIALLREDIGYLVKLGQELTRPVLPNAAAIDYIPSQFLCEFIKKCGYHGVLYESSVGEGINFSLFNPENATIFNTNRHYVIRVSVELGP